MAAVIGVFIAEALIGGGFTTVAGAVAAGAFSFAAVAVAANIGVALIASRLIAGSGSRGGGGFQDQGVRIQIPPSSENKIPIIYGHAFQQGIITDARISNGNTTMSYVLVLSEKTTTGDWTVGDIYWNDQILNFKPDGFTVESSTVGGETNTKLADKVRMWVYAGGTAAANQIKGPTPAVNAYDTLSTSTNYQLSNLVFAVVQLDYDSANGITGLPTLTFEITNSLKNPGSVWYDYMTARYGAAITATNIDTVSCINTTTSTSLYNISNQIPPNQTYTISSTVYTSYQPRYEINGILNTGDTIKANLDRINMASASWTTYDGKQGKWKVITNTSATVAQLANAFVFNDDNIIGEINLTSTNLEDIYNSVEVGFADRNIRDQTDYYTTSTTITERNDLEPDNVLRLKLDLVNNPINAGRIGNLELRQSRRDLVITFTSDYTGLQVEAGEIIKVTNSIYGFNNKLFRVSRVREIESDNGILLAEIVALEYDSAVYQDVALNEVTDRPQANFVPINSSIGLPKPTTATNIDNPGGAAITIGTQIPATSYPVKAVEVFIAPSDNLGNPTADFSLHTVISPNTGTFVSETTATIDVPYINYTNGYYVTKARTINGDVVSEFSDISDPFEITQGTLSGGSVQTALNADNIMVSYLTQGSSIYITGAPAYGDYESIEADTGTYIYRMLGGPTKMYVDNWEVSTVTNVVYGQFLSTGTQTLAANTSVQAVNFDISKYYDGITLSTSSHINLPSTGTYNIAISAIFDNASANAEQATMWLRTNGVDETDSATAITVPAKHGSTNGAAVLSATYINNHNAGDYLELFWAAETTDVRLSTISSSTVAPIYPRSPAVVLSIFKAVGAPPV